MAILFLLGFVLFKKLITCKIAGYFFLPVFSQKKIPPFAGGKIINKNYMYRYKVNLQCHIYPRYN